MIGKTLIAPMLVLAALVVSDQTRAGTITWGITSGTALSLPHYIAEEKKFYQAEGVAVDTVITNSAARLLQQVAAGALNIGQAATDQSLRAIMHGAPLRIVASAAANAPFRMVAGKGIKSWSDLKGKTITVGGPTDVTLYFLHVMARKNGLADQDYDVIYAGGTPDRFAQLVAGAVAGAILTNPHDFIALGQGFVDLGSVPQYLPHWEQNNIVVDARWAGQHRADVEAVLRAHIRATGYFYDPANREEVISILAAKTKATREIAAETYDLYVREGVFAKDAEPRLDGIEANLDAFVAMSEIKPPLPAAASFFDLSFLAGAAKQGAAR
jgi:NitT/TauT family transport system substrate-binding protein